MVNDQLETFEIEFPPGIDKDELASLEKELARAEGIDQCGWSTSRALDPVSLSMWFVLAKHVAVALTSAVPVIKFVVDQLKQRGIKNVKIVLANGSTIQADDISVDNLLKLERSARSAPLRQ
jgi:hypothetical protein